MQSTGKYQLKTFRKQLDINFKNKNEFVTAVDINSEKMLKQKLNKLLPQASFFGEETGRTSSRPYEWIVDPVDGTTNFVKGIDQFSISIALTENNIPVTGVIYKPFSDEFFYGVKDHGAYYQDKPLTLKKNTELKNALIATGFPYRSPQYLDTFMQCAREVLQTCSGIRRLGSAALDLSYLAAGFFDGFWESDLKPYDIAAALVLLQETGCITVNEKNQKYKLFEDRIFIAAHPAIFKDFAKIIIKYYN
ncbi:MAG TPA: inositol monophosphatase family protein [Spirochaetota bacterium]|nr:inositol monophosphatase family protein [Spirochaetota bacterium]